MAAAVSAVAGDLAAVVGQRRYGTGEPGTAASTEPAPRIGAPNPMGIAEAKPIPPAPVARRAAAPAPAPKAPVATTIAAFNLKLLVVAGATATDRDVTVSFSNRQLTVLPTDGSAPLLTIPYTLIEKATYVHAGEPRWDPALSAPVGTIDVPGSLGRKRHWLAVQTRDAYAILRLDGGGWQRVIESFESITGRRIER